MKIVIKKAIFMLIIAIILIGVNTQAYALSEIMKDGQDFISRADSSQTDVNKYTLMNVSEVLVNILIPVGVVVAVVVAAVLGIQFMTGGAEGQAKVKEMIIPFVVGCIIVFGGFTIWKIALSIGSKVDDVASTVISTSIIIS